MIVGAGITQAIDNGAAPRAVLQMAIDAGLKILRQRIAGRRPQHRQRRIILVPAANFRQLRLEAAQGFAFLAVPVVVPVSSHACRTAWCLRSSSSAYWRWPLTCVSLMPVS